MIFVSNLKSDNIYKIDSIISKYPSDNSYIDIQYVKIKMTQSFYKLNFEFVLYVSNNFLLPANSIKMEANLPTSTIQDISLIKTNEQVDININDIQYDAIDVYKANFSIDISDDNFFKNTSNKNFNIDLNYDFDSSLLNKDNSNINPIVFETFLSELLNLKHSLKINFSGYTEVNKNGFYKHPYYYESDTRNKISINQFDIKFETENFSDVDYPIKKLFSFYISDNNNEQITISNVKLVLNYKYNNINKKCELLFDSELDYNSDSLSFLLNNYETYFDETKKEMIFQYGNKGITFPFDTNGKYQVGFTLTIKNKPINYKITNNFNYVYSKNKANFVVEQLFEDLIDYEEIVIE